MGVRALSSQDIDDVAGELQAPRTDYFGQVFSSKNAHCVDYRSFCIWLTIWSANRAARLFDPDA
jgi:hypothetical protein